MGQEVSVSYQAVKSKVYRLIDSLVEDSKTQGEVQESGLSPQHESAKGSSAKRPSFQNAGKHVSRKCVTGCALPAIIASVGCAEVGIDLIVGRSNFELCISPKRIFG